MSYRISQLAIHLGALWIATSALAGCSGEPNLISTLDNEDAGASDVAVDRDTTLPQDTGQDVTRQDTGTTVTGPSVDAYCAEAARLMCDRLYDCAGETAALRLQLESDFSFDNKYECRQKMTRRLVDFCHPAAVSSQKGRVTYDPQAADSCLTTMQTTSCSSFSQGLPPLRAMTLFEPAFCGDIGQATRQIADSCLSNTDCVGDSVFCDGAEYSGSTATNGTCVTLGDEGTACTFPEDCSEGLYCDANGECARPPGDGESCTNLCQSGLVCNRQVNQCKPLGGDGDPCSEAAECQPSLACGADNTCQAPPGDGEQCFERCAAGLRCNFQTTTCEPLPGQGEDCTSACAAGLTCASDFTCQPVANAGESCASAACVDGLECDASSTCTAASVVGEACQAGECAWYATCATAGTCEALPSLGEQCSGECINPAICSGGSCVDPSNLEACDGGSCSAADEFCDDGLCVKG